jgi:alkylhydroperoxidase AhpD family core domain
MIILDDVERLYDTFSRAAYEPRHLDGKTKELIAFSNAVIIDCKHCMRVHYKRAIEAGAAEEEIAEATAIAMSISAGKAMAVAREVIGEITAGNK